MFSIGFKPKAYGWIAALLLSAAAWCASGAPLASPVPSLVPGESLRYLLEYRSTIESQSQGPIYTSTSGHQLDISLGARLGFDVLGVTEDLKRGRLARLRATIETCDATVHGSPFDAGAQALEKQYRSLQGQSFDFTIDGRGRITDLAGLDVLKSDPNAQDSIRQWLSSIALPLGLWKPGLRPGKKWSREIPLSVAPLAGLVWRTVSTYRDNEPCPAPLATSAAAPRQMCAVITTRLQTLRNSSQRDSTPNSYLQHGLETSGQWRGTGESLSFVSLSSGLVASGTASETDTMNVIITSALSGSRLHYAGQARSSSHVALISVSFRGKGSSHE